MSSNKKTTATKEDGKPTLVPKLRFPEFRNDGEWITEALGQLANYENGKAYEQDITESGKYVVVNSRFISTDGAVLKYTNAEYLVAEAGDVLMVLSDLPKGKALAKCYFVEANNRYAVNQRVCRLKPKKIDGKFLYYALNRHPRLLAFDDGLNQTHLSKGGVTECPLCVPRDKDEQNKIAKCLSSVDKVIAAQAHKVDVLKTHKKGLMQQLFPREGETQPRLRFPEFQKDGEWEVKPLGKVAENLDNQRVPITSTNRKAGDVPYYGASGIVDYVEGFIFDEDLLCVSEDGANLRARTYPIAFAISGKTWVNNHAHVLRFEHACTQKFVELYLNSIKLDDFIAGMAQPKLNKAMLDRIPIPHPRVPEQERIASCLGCLDDLIAAETQKLEALKLHKTGLMQQLFPLIEDIES